MLSMAGVWCNKDGLTSERGGESREDVDSKTTPLINFDALNSTCE